MKKMVLFLCSLFLTAGITGIQAQTKNSNEAEVTYSVSVHCNNCKKKIESALPHEKGVKDLKVSVEEQSVWITYDTTKTNKDLLRKAIEKLGYTATEKDTEKPEATTGATVKKASDKKDEGKKKGNN